MGPHSEDRKEEILRAYQERASMRGITRQTLANWLKEKAARLPDSAQILQPARPDEVLELDELWSFVLKKANKSWIWKTLSFSKSDTFHELVLRLFIHVYNVQCIS